MVRLHDKYRGVRTMVDTFFKKIRVRGGGVVPRLPCRYMSMYETMAAFDKAKSCHKCLIYDMQINQ